MADWTSAKAYLPTGISREIVLVGHNLGYFQIDSHGVSGALVEGCTLSFLWLLAMDICDHLSWMFLPSIRDRRP